MSNYKIYYRIQKQNGNKQNSVLRESLLLDQTTAESFNTQFLQIQKEFEGINIESSQKLKKLEKFLKLFKEKDLSENTRYVEINTFHDILENKLEIHSKFPPNT